MSAARDLARQLAVSDRTVRRAVERQMLRGTRSSPNKLAIAEAERRYATTHWPLLRSLVDALRTESSVEMAVLFGSAARGDDTPDSDVDLLVQFRPNAAAGARSVSGRLSRALNREVEIVTLDDAASDPQLLLDVIEEGRPLIDRADRWQKLRRRRAALLREAAAHRSERNRAAHVAWAQLDG